MKRFTCKEIMNGEGGCDKVFEAETAMDISKISSGHFMETTDEAHKPMRDMMTTGHSKEEADKWWAWFSAEWDKKELS
ncbi:MAG: hypothetical protein OCD02_05785 [Spirochaetaceae bacterium]